MFTWRTGLVNVIIAIYNIFNNCGFTAGITATTVLLTVLTSMMPGPQVVLQEELVVTGISSHLTRKKL